jgi:hypothetical protein
VTAKAYDSGRQLEVHLGPEKAKQVSNLLLQGEKISNLVERIQGEWKLMLDKKPETVRTILYRYNRGVTKKQTVKRVIDTVTVSKHVKVTTLTELADLCAKQKKRIEKALTMEDRAPLLLEAASREMRLLKDMLRDLALLQIETGILARAPKTIQGMISDPSGRTTQFAWLESDENLLSALKEEAGMLDDRTLDGEAIDVEVSDDESAG